MAVLSNQNKIHEMQISTSFHTRLRYHACLGDCVQKTSSKYLLFIHNSMQFHTFFLVAQYRRDRSLALLRVAIVSVSFWFFCARSKFSTRIISHIHVCVFYGHALNVIILQLFNDQCTASHELITDNYSSKKNLHSIFQYVHSPPDAIANSNAIFCVCNAVYDGIKTCGNVISCYFISDQLYWLTKIITETLQSTILW